MQYGQDKTEYGSETVLVCPEITFKLFQGDLTVNDNELVEEMNHLLSIVQSDLKREKPNTLIKLEPEFDYDYIDETEMSFTYDVEFTIDYEEWEESGFFDPIAGYGEPPDEGVNISEEQHDLICEDLDWLNERISQELLDLFKRRFNLVNKDDYEYISDLDRALDNGLEQTFGIVPDLFS